MSRIYKRDDAYWIDFKDAKGLRRRKKIGPSKRIAKEVLDGILGNVARHQHLGIIDESPISFADFAEEWKRRVATTLRPRSRDRWFRLIENHLKPAFPGALRGITQVDVEAYVARRLEAGVSPATVNVETGVLKHILKRALEWDFIAANRATKVKPLREAPGRVRFLTPEEITQLLDAMKHKPILKAFTLVALNTGMRRNEILWLTRSAIDWTNRIASIETTKNGDARRVHLNDTAFDALRSLPIRIDGRLFDLKPHPTSIAFKRIVRRAGIQDFRLHDLRHCFASYQAMAGIQGRGLQSLLGHRDGRMTQRYSHLSDAYLQAAVNAVNLGANNPENGTHMAPAVAKVGKA